jgi:hypothetical protein
LVAERAALVARTSIVTGVVEPISGCSVACVLPAREVLEELDADLAVAEALGHGLRRRAERGDVDRVARVLDRDLVGVVRLSVTPLMLTKQSVR